MDYDGERISRKETVTTLDGLDSKPAQLLEDWKRRCRSRQRSHCLAVDQLLRRNRLIFLGDTLLAVILAWAVLVLVQTQFNPHWRIVAGAAGVGAIALLALQGSLSYFEKAERHRSAAAHYDSVRREIEQLIALGPAYDDNLRVAIDRIRERMDHLSEQSPQVPMWDERRDDSSNSKHD